MQARCFKCQSPLVKGEPSKEAPRTAMARPYLGNDTKHQGTTANVTLTTWVCPTCHKTRAVGAQQGG